VADAVAKQKDKLLQDFNEVVSDAEQLLKAVAASGGDKAQALRQNVEEKLEVARKRLVELEHQVMEQARAAAHNADEYVHDKPWQAVGIAAAGGALLGILLGLLLNRSR
jgi:ElaB/YqjD/DUF883 family membrane-anchored ribosome-binding protein